MRELFEEVAGRSALDPQEAVKRSSRSGLRKRFYEAVDVDDVPGGLAVLLDGKPIRTLSGKIVIMPVRSLADKAAEEWQAQSETIDPMTMPLTRLANSVAEGVVDRVDDVLADIAKYFESDLLCYRAGHPRGLIEREAQAWDPVLRWAAETLGAHFILAEGIVHAAQPPQAIAACRAALPSEPWAVAACHVVTTITGSALLALALDRGARDAEQVWTAAHVDEDWNAEQWGIDDEVAARRAARRIDFDAAASVLDAMRRSPGNPPPVMV